MVVDIHKVITSNPITKGIMSPWGSNSKANSSSIHNSEFSQNEK